VFQGETPEKWRALPPFAPDLKWPVLLLVGLLLLAGFFPQFILDLTAAVVPPGIASR
jgi:hypothetical protein